MLVSELCLATVLAVWTVCWAERQRDANEQREGIEGAQRRELTRGGQRAREETMGLVASSALSVGAVWQLGNSAELLRCSCSLAVWHCLSAD